VYDEHVLVVPTEFFHRIGYFQGFCRDVDRYLKHLLQPGVLSYRPRSQMERDPSFKQLIPYVIFRYRDTTGMERLFSYTRGSGQGEARLHAKRSIGVGGHISADDASRVGQGDAYQEGLRRELAEEVIIQTAYQDQCVGLINDDKTEVGQVHLGIVYIYDVEQPCVYARETEIQEATFVPVEELIQDRVRFETWSQICLDNLFAGAQR
jgi:predicted NUDIX family phosphoesterase